MTRPESDRDGPCVCDYNPETTDGPSEDCPFHGRPYHYWIERGDILAERIRRVEALAHHWATDPHALGGIRNVGEVVAHDLRAALHPKEDG